MEPETVVTVGGSGQGWWIPWATLILGWLLAQLNPWIAAVITAPRRRRELRRALGVELSEIRITMAGAEWKLRAKLGTLDYPFFQWYSELVLTTADRSPDTVQMKELVERLRESQQIAEAHMRETVTQSQSRGPYLFLQKYGTPFLDAHVGDLGLFETNFQIAAFAVRRHMDLFNGSAETSEAIKFKLMDDPQRQDLALSLQALYKVSAVQAHAVAENIGIIVAHKDCNL